MNAMKETIIYSEIDYFKQLFSLPFSYDHNKHALYRLAHNIYFFHGTNKLGLSDQCFIMFTLIFIKQINVIDNLNEMISYYNLSKTII